MRCEQNCARNLYFIMCMLVAAHVCDIFLKTYSCTLIILHLLKSVVFFLDHFAFLLKYCHHFIQFNLFLFIAIVLTLNQK